MGEAVVSFVVENISNLLIEGAQVLHRVSDQLEEVVAKFRWMQTFLRDADARQKEERVGRWIADLRELVYDAEDAIESFVHKASSLKKGGIIKRYVCVLDECVYRHKFGREMEAIQRRMAELTRRLHDYNIRSIRQGESSSSTSSNETPGKLKRFYNHAVVDEPQVVGLQEDVESLVAHLVNESDECYPLISICGMGGIGKTTLASKIYNHSTIKSHFDALAWVSISQKWQTKDVLVRVLYNLAPEKRNEISNMEEIKLLECLLEIQQSKKCLLVLDDIWSNDAWDSLKAGFPTGHFKCKLMLTSRNMEVARYVNPNGFIHQPRLLNEEQSWKLLHMKALSKLNYLDARDVKEMEELGREMVGHCAGLPLAIVVLGGILVTKPTWIEWKKVHQEIQSSIRSGEGMGEQHQREVLEILALSYNDLPYQLKPCFLYLGKFGEDVWIETERLYQLWIAEGFILSSDRREGETLTEVAESYLAELLHKCMVGVRFEEEESSLRKFNSCRLHDLMRDLSLSKAKEEDFFKVLDLRKGNANHHDQLFEKSTYTRRLVIYVDDVGEGIISTTIKDIPLARKARRRVRSVLLFRVRWWNIDVLHFSGFRLLRVLAFEGFFFLSGQGQSIKQGFCDLLNLSRLNQVLGNLVHLRYLSLRDSSVWFFFPSFMQNLDKLQTLDLRVENMVIQRLPWARNDVLQNMGRLLHLYLPYSGRVHNRGKTKLQFHGLRKLETLENFESNYCEVNDLWKLNNLRKLTLLVSENLADLEEMVKYLASGVSSFLRYSSLIIEDCDLHHLGNDRPISVLRKLLLCRPDGCNINRLMISGPIRELSSVVINNDHAGNNIFSSSLTELSFYNSKLEEDPMPVLEKIPALRKLILGDGAFLGKEMVCSAMGFPQLTFLELHALRNLEKWRVDGGSMPNLSDLKISFCPQLTLEELPERLIKIHQS